MFGLYIFFIVVVILAIIILLIRLRWILKRNIRLESKEQYLNKIQNISIPEDAPNIIIVNCDDLGYGDIGCFKNILIRTPNIDSIGENGIIFTDFYSAAPVCSPSRAGLLTGRFPVRTHVPTVFFPSKHLMNMFFWDFFYSYGMQGLSPDEITIPDVLQRIGYHTQMLGKWHLGDHEPFLPNNFGFNHFFGALYSNDMNPYHIYENKEISVHAPVDQNQITKLFTEKALNFIESNQDHPFFIYYAQPFPHFPLHASDNFRGKSSAGLYGDAVEELDWSLGEILKKLKNFGVYDNTLIIFTSDNGPWHEGNPGFLRGRKYQSFEGGQRIPMIISWPRRIKHKIVNTPFSHMDLLPTIFSLLEIPLPGDRIIDGRDISDIFNQTASNNENDNGSTIYYFFNKKLQAIREDQWKYHIKHRSDNSSYFILHPGPFLFDLAKDKNESYDVSMNFQEKAKNLAGKLSDKKNSLRSNLRGWKKRR